MEIKSIGPMKRAVLDNGLTVLVAPSDAAPVVAVQVWVSVGSADEMPGQEGLAHLCEHMLFKGTQRRGVGEMAREIESVGGDVNAWTSFDQTVYHVVLASRFFDLGLDVLSDAVLGASFDAEELEREKAVVLEEIKRTRDMPGSWLGDLLFSNSFVRHPYGHPVLGTKQTVSSVTRRHIVNFFKRHYTPSRMTLIVVGDVTPSRVFSKARKIFGTVRKKSAARRARTVEPARRSMKVKLVYDDIHEAHMGAAWHIPAVAHEDVPALDALASLMGQGESSRFSLRLKRGANLVNEAFAFAYTPLDPGLFVAGLSCPVPVVGKALGHMMKEIVQLQRQQVDLSELDKIKAMVESENIYSRETVQGWARRLGYYQVLMNDPLYADTYLSKVLRLRPDDIQAVAQKYLPVNRCAVVGVIPQESRARVSKATIVKVIKGLGDRSLTKSGPGSKKGKSEAKRIRLPNGPTLIIQESHENQIVAIRSANLAGVRYENKGNSGINNLLSDLMTRGTQRRSASQVAQEMDMLAANLGGYSGRNTLGLRAEFPSKNLDKALDLFTDCLLHPSFPLSEVRREKELALEEISSRQDQLSSLAFDLFASTLYEKHPYGLTVLGTKASVSKMSRKNLASYYRKFISPKDMVLGVVGDVNRDELVEKLSGMFAGTSRKGGVLPKLKTDPAPRSIRVALKYRQRAQAHLVLGFSGTTMSSKDRHALEVMMAVLAGQGGRLFVELRDKRSLAYSVTGFSMEGLEPGYIALYLGLDPSRIQEGVEGMLEQLARLIHQPVSRTEMDRARRFLVGTHEISLQRAASRAASMTLNELYGLGYMAHSKYAAAINSVTTQSLSRVAHKYLKLDSYVLAAVGPKKNIDVLKSFA